VQLDGRGTIDKGLNGCCCEHFTRGCVFSNGGSKWMTLFPELSIMLAVFMVYRSSMEAKDVVARTLPIVSGERCLLNYSIVVE